MNITPAALIIVELLKPATCMALAKNASEIAEHLSAHKFSCDARRARQIIAEELDAIASLLSPRVLISRAPHGYWLAETTEEIVEREAILWSLEKASKAKRRQFIEQVRAAGLAGVLPDRTKKAVAA